MLLLITRLQRAARAYALAEGFRENCLFLAMDSWPGVARASQMRAVDVVLTMLVS